MKLVAAAAACLVAGGCAGADVALTHAVFDNAEHTVIVLGFNACNADLDVDIEVGDAEIVVTATDPDRPWFSTGGDDCQDITTLELDQPLGNRTITDAATGQAIEVEHPDWLDD